ncbi:MAG: Gfo/Idh/MocA family protein [Actinomycetota bacterium]
MPAAIGVGFIGYGWMGRTHAHALHTIDHLAPLDRPVRLVSISGRNAGRVEHVARTLGFERWTTRWEEVVEDPAVEVVAVLAATHAHAAPSIAALEADKPVLCEKPLGSDAREAARMLDAADRAGVTNACGFNYRFVPAVRLARDVIASGALGSIRHYRALYLQDWAGSPELPRTWRFEARGGANGAVGDYSHLVDLLRYLVGEPVSAIAETHRLIADRPDPGGDGRLPVEVEDWYAAALRMPGGSTATLEASRCATGWKGRQLVEVDGTEGSLWWDMEDLNRLHLFLVRDEKQGLGGFRDVLVTEGDHPFMEHWWAPGHIIGWEHTFVHQWRELLGAFLRGEPVGEHQASFADGCRAAAICDGILEAARTERRVRLSSGRSPAREPTVETGVVDP